MEMRSKQGMNWSRGGYATRAGVFGVFGVLVMHSG